MAVTVLDGNPPPEGPIPIEHFRADKKLVRSSEPVPRGSELEFFLFGVQLYVVLDPGSDPQTPAAVGARPPPEDGALRAVLLLGKTGIRLVDLKVRTGRKPQTLPGWLSGTRDVGNSVADAARGGRLESMLFGEADRSVLGSDDLFQRAMKELPKPDVLRLAETAVRAHPRPAGIVVDELYLLARGPKGDLWAFELNIDEDQRGVVLDSSPLLRADRRDPHEREEPPDLPPPVPPPPPPPPPPPSRRP